MQYRATVTERKMHTEEYFGTQEQILGLVKRLPDIKEKSIVVQADNACDDGKIVGVKYFGSSSWSGEVYDDVQGAVRQPHHRGT